MSLLRLRRLPFNNHQLRGVRHAKWLFFICHNYVRLPGSTATVIDNFALANPVSGRQVLSQELTEGCLIGISLATTVNQLRAGILQSIPQTNAPILHQIINGTRFAATWVGAGPMSISDTIKRGRSGLISGTIPPSGGGIRARMVRLAQPHGPMVCLRLIFDAGFCLGPPDYSPANSAV